MSIIQSRRRADLAAVAVSGIAKAWTAYTPSISAGTGTFTSVSATGRYLTAGKVTFIQISVTVTTNGSAASFVIATLPVAAGGGSLYVVAGRDHAASGKLLQCFVAAASSNLFILNYDNTYPAVSGSVLHISGCYENA